MQIIGGKARGQIIKFPKSRKTRPVSGKVREAVFAILGNKITGASVLDLYAGSGSLGIEALSRGAEKALFVDGSKVCLGLINQNLSKTGLSRQAKVRRTKVEKFLEMNQDKFDIIFADPPWKEINLTVLNSLSKFLKPRGIVAIFHSKKNSLGSLKNLIVADQRIYGDSGVTFLEKAKI